MELHLERKGQVKNLIYQWIFCFFILHGPIALISRRYVEIRS